MRWMVAVFLAGALVSGGAQTRMPEAANPVLVSAVAPRYPRSRFSNPSRTVLVGLTVNAAGVPESVHVVRSGGDRFDKDAVATVTQYRFKPAMEAGQAVARDIEVEVSYKAK